MGNTSSIKSSSTPSGSPLALRKSRSRILTDIQIIEYSYDKASGGVFTCIPEGVVKNILRRLAIQDLCRLSCVSKGLHELSNSTELWNEIKTTQMPLHKSAVAIPQNLKELHPKAQLGSLNSIRSDTYNYLFTVSIFGAPKVGKTTLCNRITSPDSNGTHILYDYESKNTFKLKINNKDDCTFAFILYDITDAKSFEYLKVGKSWNPPAIVIGTKSDLSNDRQVTYDQGKSFAQSRHLSFIEVDLNSWSSMLEFLELFGDVIRSFVEKLTPKSPRVSRGPQ